MAWSNAFLNKMRKYWCRNIVKAQYYASNTNNGTMEKLLQKMLKTQKLLSSLKQLIQRI